MLTKSQVMWLFIEAFANNAVLLISFTKFIDYDDNKLSEYED